MYLEELGSAQSLAVGARVQLADLVLRVQQVVEVQRHHHAGLLGAHGLTPLARIRRNLETVRGVILGGTCMCAETRGGSEGAHAQKRHACIGVHIGHEP